MLKNFLRRIIVLLIQIAEEMVMLENCNKEMAMLPLPNGKFQFNELGIITTQEFGFKEGWIECCKWILQLMEELTYTGDNGGEYIDIPDLETVI